MRSLIYPPIAPLGIDDLFPGPGAGFYPHRYVLNHETSCRTHVDINCLHILNVPVLFLFVCSGIGGGGGMHVGNITSTEHFPVCLLYACACLDIHLTPYFWHNRSKWSTFLPFKSLPFPIWWPWVCFVFVSLNFAFQKSFSGTFFLFSFEWKLMFENRSVPPGGRYDPIGPPGVPGFEPSNVR